MGVGVKAARGRSREGGNPIFDFFGRSLRKAAGLLLLAASAALAQAPLQPEVGQQSKDSVWVPTPERMIRRLLQLADTTRDDVVIDLGSGDGRFPIYAAKHFGARGIGVELEENLIEVSNRAAREQGVSNRVTFLQQDLYEADLSQATVVALYISPGVMERLKPRLLGLKPGTRIVSHYFTLGDWEHDEKIEVESRTGYLWVVPAPIEGAWRVSIPGEDFRLRIERRYQKLVTSGERGGKPLHVIGARLRGTEITFSSFDRDGGSRTYRGRLEGGRMAGGSDGWPGLKPLPWSAVRESD